MEKWKFDTIKNSSWDFIQLYPKPLGLCPRPRWGGSASPDPWHVSLPWCKAPRQRRFSKEAPPSAPMRRREEGRETNSSQHPSTQALLLPVWPESLLLRVFSSGFLPGAACLHDSRLVSFVASQTWVLACSKAFAVKSFLFPTCRSSSIKTVAHVVHPSGLPFEKKSPAAGAARACGGRTEQKQIKRGLA